MRVGWCAYVVRKGCLTLVHNGGFKLGMKNKVTFVMLSNDCPNHFRLIVNFFYLISNLNHNHIDK